MKNFYLCLMVLFFFFGSGYAAVLSESPLLAMGDWPGPVAPPIPPEPDPPPPAPVPVDPVTPIPTPDPLPLTNYVWENSDSKPGKSYIMPQATMSGHITAVLVNSTAFTYDSTWHDGRELWYGPKVGAFPAKSVVRVILDNGTEYASNVQIVPPPKPPAPPAPGGSVWDRLVDYGANDSVAIYDETGKAWVSYTYPASAGGSYRYLSHKNQGLARVGTAKWTIRSIPFDGNCEIIVTFRPSENRTSDADYSVIAGGKTVIKKSINQRGTSGSKKVLLGTIAVKKGQTVSVLLDGTDDNQSDCADAAYFKLRN
jgi:hypothetical protein